MFNEDDGLQIERAKLFAFFSSERACLQEQVDSGFQVIFLRPQIKSA